MNIYSDSSHSALKYLKDTKANIHNLLIMFDDFNIRDSLWDPLFPHHTFISDDFLIITDLFNLDLSNPTNQVLTRYSDNINDSNLVIDLMFLHSSSRKLNNHSIYPEWYLTSYHASLTITIPIVEESVNSTKHSIIKDSDKETAFINDITLSIRNLNMSNLSDIVSLNNIVNDFTNKVNNAWEKSSKIINIMKHSKSWWNENCNRDLANYRLLKNLEDWKTFQRTVKNTKSDFFDLKIQEIANKKHSSWELINWVNKWKFLAIEAIKFNSQPYLEISNLWHALHNFFNTALYHNIKENVLDEITSILPSFWEPFSEEEFLNTLTKCNNLSTPGLDKLLWSHLKHVFKNKACLNNIIRIANMCINLGYWLSHFKISTTIIIPKPNKSSYDMPKFFKLIVLLNTLSKKSLATDSNFMQYPMISFIKVNLESQVQVYNWCRHSTDAHHSLGLGQKPFN